MMRVLEEVCVGSGKPYSSFINQKQNSRTFTPILIGLEADRKIIYNRINQRVDLMINDGLLAEAKTLFPNKEAECTAWVTENYSVILIEKFH
jgi:tRNA dimethylallyltransferase